MSNTTESSSNPPLRPQSLNAYSTSMNLSGKRLLDRQPSNEYTENLPDYVTKDNPKPAEFIARKLFHDFARLATKKVEKILSQEVKDKPLFKSLQRGEDQAFDQILVALGAISENCLPCLLKSLITWHKHQITKIPNLDDTKAQELIKNRELLIEFIFCLALIEVFGQLSLHPGHEELIEYIENLAFQHFKFVEGTEQSDSNLPNIYMLADLYGEVIGVLARNRFQSVRKKFLSELKELRARDPTPYNMQCIISLLMGMKFFRVKMAPIEDFEASFQFLQECAQYFLEIRHKDIKHALAGLFVEILVPVAATVKNEVNVPCLKNFVDILWTPTLDMCVKKKHSLALFPFV